MRSISSLSTFVEAHSDVHLHDLGVVRTRLERGWPMWGCDKERDRRPR